MKRFLALAALVLGLASCQTEPEGLNVNVGGEVDTTITVTIPDTETRAGGNNSAVGAFGNVDFTKYTIRYIFEVYYGETGVQKQVYYTDDMTASFPVRLVPGRDYNFVAWADVVPHGNVPAMGKALPYEGSNVVENHYDADYLNAITFIGEWNAMDETRDAYSGFHNTNGGEKYTGSSSINIRMTRPFAKLRVITTDMNELNALGITPVSAKVTYSAFSHESFNALSGTYSDDTIIEEHIYEIANYADQTGANKVLFTDYFFADDNDVVKFQLDVYEGDVNHQTPTTLIKHNDFTTDIPVQRNYLTTIQGNVLTDGNNVKVTVEDNGAFAGEKVEKIVEVGNATDLQEAINNSTEETTIVLGGDIVLGDGIITLAATRAEAPQYALLVPADKVVNLDLNGKTIRQEKECTANYSMLVNKGTLTIKGNGKISFKDTGAGDPTYGWGSYTLRNEGTLFFENGIIEHLGEQDAHMICAIFQYSGHSTINGGKISTPNYRSARLWSGDMTINGGEFNGQLWLQAVNDTSDLTINGGTFAPCGGDSSSVFVTNSGKSVKFAVNGGHFTTKIGMSNPFGCITGGTFTIDAKEGTNEALLANGYAFVDGENGTYTVENVGHYTDAEGNEHITTAAGLLWFAGEVNKYSNYERPFENVTIYLENDIDLDGIEWTPIGDYRFSANRFCGTFDGQNHTISNFKITKKTDKNDSNKSSYGFFGNLEGTVKNVKVSKVNVSSYAYTAALVGRFNNGLIENCHVVDCAVSNTYWQGGILIGQTNAEGEVVAIVRNCSVSNSSITSKSAIGAISGPVTANKGGNVVFENCSVANCAVNQNGSFGGSYDKYFGSMFGYTEADADSSIEIKNFTVSNTTVKGESNAPISGDFDGNITIDGCKMVTVDTEDGLVKAVKAQSIITLANDITMSKSVAISNANFTLDGNGYTITMAEDATNTYALFDITGGKASINNVVFDGIKEGAVVRTVDVEFTAENVTAKNGQHTQVQGIFRLVGKSTIKNCTFEGNTCNMVITLNFDGANNDPQVVENCVFEDNTCNSTAVLYYVKGAGATINGNKFVGNTVNCNGNGATVYMGFQENCIVKNNLFQNNTVNEAGTSSRVAGGIFFGYNMEFTGNAFVGNKVTGENAVAKDVCVSTYYTSIALSGNYWGGNAPVENTNYFVQHKSDERVVIINDYLTANPFN